MVTPDRSSNGNSDTSPIQGRKKMLSFAQRSFLLPATGPNLEIDSVSRSNSNLMRTSSKDSNLSSGLKNRLESRVS